MITMKEGDPVFAPISEYGSSMYDRDSRELVFCSFVAVSVIMGSAFFLSHRLATAPVLHAVQTVVEAKRERDIQLMARSFPTKHETPTEGTTLPTITIEFPRIP